MRRESYDLLLCCLFKKRRERDDLFLAACCWLAALLSCSFMIAVSSLQLTAHHSSSLSCCYSCNHSHTLPWIWYSFKCIALGMSFLLVRRRWRGLQNNRQGKQSAWRRHWCNVMTTKWMSRHDGHTGYYEDECNGIDKQTWLPMLATMYDGNKQLHWRADMATYASYDARWMQATTLTSGLATSIYDSHTSYYDDECDGTVMSRHDGHASYYGDERYDNWYYLQWRQQPC